MTSVLLSDSELYGSQERVNANIRRAFDLILSNKGLQRPRPPDNHRYVGLEHALRFYENVRVRAHCYHFVICNACVRRQSKGLSNFLNRCLGADVPNF